jgi:plasmid stability protein
MATITIRNIDNSLKSRLRDQAAVHGRSMEEEARVILRVALEAESESATGLGSAFNALFRPLGGVHLDETTREPLREPPQFDR